MKKRSTRMLSLLMAICLVTQLIAIPGGLPVVDAAEEGSSPSIPAATQQYVNHTFETVKGGAIDTTGFTFDAGNTNNVAGVRSANSYIYLEKNAAENPTISRDLTDLVDSPHVVVSVDLASTALSGASLKLTGTAAEGDAPVQHFAQVAVDGKIYACGQDTGKTLTADGTFVTLTVAVNSALNTYSMWVAGEQVVQDAQIPVANFGTLTALTIELNGENTSASNLMVDNLKVYRYAGIYYENDFTTDTDVTYTPGTGVAQYQDGKLYLAKTETAQAPKLSIALPDVTYANNVVISMDISSTNFFRVYVKMVGDKATSGNTARTDPVSSSTSGSLMAASNGVRGGTLTAGTVYNIAVVLNYTNKIFNLYLNGTKCVANGNEAGEWTLADIGDLKSILFETINYNVAAGNDGDLSIDNVRVYEGSVPTSFDATKIPEAAETYIDNAFDTADGEGNAELTGLVLTAGNESNKADAPKVNHYLYLEQNDNTGKNKNQPSAVYDMSFVDSHYIVVSLDVASTKGHGPLYLTASDGTNTTINLLRLEADGQILIGGSGLGALTYVPVNGVYSHFDIVIDTDADTFTLWYNGKACQWRGAENSTVYPLNSTTDFGMLKSLKFTYGWGLNTNTMIDNLKIYTYEEGREDPTEEPTETVEPNDPTEESTEDPTQAVDPTESVDPSESIDPTESVDPTETTQPIDVGNKVYYNNDFSENADGITFANAASSGANNNIALYRDHYLYLERDGSGQPSAYWNKGDDGKGFLALSDYIVFSAQLSTSSLGESYIQLIGEDNKNTGLVLITKDGRIRFYVLTEANTTGFASKEGRITAGTPVKMDVALNLKDGTYSVWLDGEQVLENAKSLMSDSFGSLQYIRWYVHNSVLADGTTGVTNLTIDNLQVYDGLEPRENVGDVTENPDDEDPTDPTDPSDPSGSTDPSDPTDPSEPSVPSDVGNKVYYNNDFAQNADGITFANASSSGANNNIALYREHYLYLERDGSGQPSAYWNKGDDGKGVLALSDYIVFSAQLSSTSLGESYIQLIGEDNKNTGLVRIENSGNIRFYIRTETGGTGLVNQGRITAGTPIKMDVALNLKDGTYSVWLDGEKVLENAKSLISENFGSLQYIRWYVHNSVLADGTTGVTNLTIDNLQVYDGIAPKENVGEVTEKPGSDVEEPSEPSDVGTDVYYNNDFSEHTDGIDFAIQNNTAQYKDHYLYLERTQSGQPSAYWNKGTDGKGVLKISDYVVISAQLSSTSVGESYFQLIGEDGKLGSLIRIEKDGRIRFYKIHVDQNNKAGFASKQGYLPSDGTPVQLDIALNTKTGTYSAWINGELYIANETRYVPADFGKLQYMRWYVHNSILADGTTGVSNLMIDNLQVYDGVKPKTDVGEVTVKVEFERPDATPGTGRYYENDFETQSKEELTLIGGAEIRQDTDGNHYMALIPGAWFSWNYLQKWDPSEYVVFEMDVCSADHGSILLRISSDQSRTDYFVRWREDLTITPGNSATQAKLARGEYVNMAFAINAVDNTYSVWYDGNLVVANEQLPAANWGEFQGFRWDMTTGTATSLLKVDNIKIYEGLSPEDYANTVLLTEQPRDESWLEEMQGTQSPIIEYGTEALKVIDAAGAVLVNTDSLYVYQNGVRVQSTQADVDKLLANTAGKNVYKNDLGLVIISDSALELTEAQLNALQNYMLYTRPLGSDLKTLFTEVSNAEHPRIIINQEKIDRIRSDYKTNATIKDWADRIISRANTYIKGNHIEADDFGSDGIERTIRDRSICLSMAYLLTSNAKYKDFLWEDLKAAAEFDNWGHLRSWLGTADAAFGYAVAYDWLYDAWTPEQRKIMEEAVYDHVFYHQHQYVYGEKTTGLATFFLSETNRNAVTNGGLGLASIAMFEVYPDKCADLLEKTYHMLEYMMVEFAPDGANLEGPAYWEYQMRYLAPFMASTELTFGSDFNIYKAPGFASTGDFYLDIDGMTGVFNLHDAVEANHGTVGELFWLSNALDKPELTQTLLAKMDLYNVNGDIYSLLYYNSDIKQSASIDKPLDAYYRELELVTMRSSWLNSAGIYAAIHSGDHGGNSHDHIDVGNFVLDIGGQRFAGDYGKESYDLRAGGAYRYYYYRIRPEGHNVFVINPDKTGEDIGQNAYVSEVISSFVTKNRGAYTILSMNESYAGYAESATRGLMLGDDRNSVLIRDEIRGMTQDENEVWWFMQMEGVTVEISEDGKSAILSKGGVNVRVMVASDNATDWEIKVLDAKEMYPKEGLVDQELQNTNTGWSRLAIVFKSGKDLNINVKFAEVDNAKGDTPIENISLADWSIEDGILKATPTLYNIKIGGKDLPNFNSNLTFYNYALPYGTTECPEVTVTGGEGCDVEISKPKTLPGYLKITVTSRDDEELQTNYRVYLTVSGPIAVEASHHDGNIPQNMLDGDLSTRWAADYAAWAIFTFAAPTEVDAVWIAGWEQNARKTPFTLEVSEDGVNFVQVLDTATTMRESGEPDQLEEFKIPAGTYKAIRINTNGALYPDGRDYSWMSILEVVFYYQGKPIEIKTESGEVIGGNTIEDVGNTGEKPTDPTTPSTEPTDPDATQGEANQGGDDNSEKPGGNTGTIVLIACLAAAAVAVVVVLLIILKRRKALQTIEQADVPEEPDSVQSDEET